jgi:hypothetical protein
MGKDARFNLGKNAEKGGKGRKPGIRRATHTRCMFYTNVPCHSVTTPCAPSLFLMNSSESEGLNYPF